MWWGAFINKISTWASEKQSGTGEPLFSVLCPDPLSQEREAWKSPEVSSERKRLMKLFLCIFPHVKWTNRGRKKGLTPLWGISTGSC